MRHEPRRAMAAGLRRSVLAAVAVLAAAGLATAEDYLLQPGDVVEMSVAGLPEMRSQAAIQIDGSLSLPFVGTLEAAGVTLSRMRGQIQTALASQLIPVYLTDGTEVTRTIERNQVSASVVEYRPIFVSGDVMQPGEFPFRPGMTARQAIAAAGGVASAPLVSVGYDPIELRTQFGAAWQAAAVATARVWRLKRELGDDAEFDRQALPPAPDAAGALDEVLDVERRIADERAAAQARERSYLSKQVDQIDQQLEVLQSQVEAEKQGEAEDADALAVAVEATEKGVLTQSRLRDLRTASLMSATRRLQTEVNLMQLERRRREVARELERLDEDLTLDLLAELQDARVAEERDTARLSAVIDKLDAAGLAPPSLQGNVGLPEITLVRGGAAVAGAAAYDTPVQPGDILEVRRRLEAPAG